MVRGTRKALPVEGGRRPDDGLANMRRLPSGIALSGIGMLVSIFVIGHAAGASDPYAGGNASAGGKLIQTSGCEGCHGAGLAGGGAAPKLVGIEKRLSTDQIAERVKHPKPPMPSFGFNDAQLANVVAYLSGLDGGTGKPVVKILPATPSTDATVRVTFPGAAPKDAQVNAEMQMGSMTHGTGWLPLSKTSDAHTLEGKVHFTMGGPWTIKVRYPGAKEIDIPLNVAG